MQRIDRENMYLRDFVFMRTELYNVIYGNSDTEALEILLRKLNELYEPMKSDTMCLENPLFNIYFLTYYSEEERVLLSEKFKNKEFNDYCKVSFNTLLSQIYRMEKTYSLECFVNGEFTKFIRRLCIVPHNNIAYVDCVSSILSAVMETKPNFYDVIRENIIDLNRFDKNTPVSSHIRYSTFAKWFESYDYIKFVDENSYIINDQLEYYLYTILNKKKEEIDYEFPFIYGTPLNMPIVFYEGFLDLFMASYKKYQLMKYKNASLEEINFYIDCLKGQLRDYCQYDFEVYEYELEILDEVKLALKQRGK